MPKELAWLRIDPKVDDRGDSCKVLMKKCKKQIQFRKRWHAEHGHKYEVVYAPER